MKNETEKKELTTFNNKLYDEVGLLPTIIAQLIIYWCNLNEFKKTMAVYEDDIYWTSLSYDQIQRGIPFNKGVSSKQIQRALNTLFEIGFIQKKRKFNSNNWYAPTEKLKEFLGSQYINLTKFNNETYNPDYDKDEKINMQQNNNPIQEQPDQFTVKPLEATYDTTVPKGYIRNPDGSIRRKIATDPIDNSDFTFIESYAEIKR